jgi:CHAT domain-containing protein
VAGLLGVEPWLAGAVRKARLQGLRAPRILHLATHCFGGDDPGPASGLALAGANRHAAGDGPATGADGLLTTAEVAGLDLHGTELVVLPACAPEENADVPGLRRAFVQAGAAALVMSLWRVTDWYAKELLLDFYGRLLDGVPRAEALRQAQLASKARHPDHPAYWAAFICQGDPGPLRGAA